MNKPVKPKQREWEEQKRVNNIYLRDIARGMNAPDDFIDKFLFEVNGLYELTMQKHIASELQKQKEEIVEMIKDNFECKFECDGDSCECETGYDVAETYKCRHCNSHDQALDDIIKKIEGK